MPSNVQMLVGGLLFIIFVKYGSFVETGTGQPDVFLPAPAYAHALSLAILQLQAQGSYTGAKLVDVFDHFLAQAQAALLAAPLPEVVDKAELAMLNTREPASKPVTLEGNPSSWAFSVPKGESFSVGAMLERDRIKVANVLLDRMRANRIDIPNTATVDDVLTSGREALGDKWPENGKTVQQVLNELGITSMVFKS